MDTGKGKFVPISENLANIVESNCGPELSRVFHVGETLTIKGSKFRVERIKTRSLRLLLLPDSPLYKEGE